MDTSVENSSITRSDATLRVINSSPEAILKEKKRARLSFRQIRTETVFNKTLMIMGVVMIIIVMGILLTLIVQSLPSIKALGPGYLWGKVWNPVSDVYGAWPFLLGTLLSSFLALAISIPFSISVAIFLGEYHPQGWLPNLLKDTVELIAAVPSVIYGFWGLAVLVPIVRSLETHIGVQPVGVGIFSSSLILAIMIIPYAASLGRSMINMVPSHLKEAAYALGATRWEVIRSVILPYTKSGLFAGILLSLGRALGETMAVTMVIGNTSLIPKNIFSPGNTRAGFIANNFPGPDKPVYLSALIELGLVLFLVTVVINLICKKIIDRVTND